MGVFMVFFLFRFFEGRPVSPLGDHRPSMVDCPPGEKPSKNLKFFQNP